jgi:DNA-binding NarL/FixJ family response regulator
LALVALCRGRVSDAVSHATEARELATNSGQVALSAMPLAELALYAALRGDENFDNLVGDLDRVVSTHQAGVLGALVDDARRWALGERELLAGQFQTALHHFEQMISPPLVHLAGYARLEAAVRAGSLEVARRWSQELAEFATAVPLPHNQALAAHAAALISQDRQRDLFEEALAHHARSNRPLDAARTRLAYGEFLRRNRQRVAAREQLRLALRVFEDAGTEPWAERARQAVRASGETVRKRDDSPSQHLTPQERQVATLVASGLSNKDVAAQLFVSPRTVDFHLRNVFGKTGVASRTELAHLDFA